MPRKELSKIKRKSLLYKSGVEYADFGLNHIEGCVHGCRYPCYAMILKRRCGQIKDYKDWCNPKTVANALELLEEEIPKYKDEIKSVYLCFSTDPFMYRLEEVNKLSLRIIERLNKDGIKSVTISKGIHPERLLDKERYGKNNEYGITVVSLSKNFQRRYEPFSAPIRKRIKTLKNLHDAGLKTWVSMEPYPTPNIFRQNIYEILEAVSFVDKIVFGKWNYNGITTNYDNYKSFYNYLSNEVIKFCQKRKINIHVKKGTIDLEEYTSKSPTKYSIQNGDLLFKFAY